jgi:hypothetical protein
MTDYTLEITKVENGYICSWWDEVENEHVKKQMVFEDTDDWQENCEVNGDICSMEAMLQFVIEHFGMCGSKHDPHRLRVSIDHQHPE